MSSPARRDARALTLLIVWSVALGALFAALLALAPAARAGTCDQVGGVITGDWTITTVQVCSGILYSVDGTISINSGGSLTLTDGGLSFSKDTSHQGYALNVNAGGEFVLDYSNVAGVHNELRVDGTSNAYLYNVTIDRTQDPAAKSDWAPAFRPTAAGGNVDFMRWLYATVVDSSGIPVSGATVWSTLSPSSTTAQYPDNALATTPTSRTLWYLHRTSSGTNAWNRTDANGLALIPLFTDQITTASLPNAESFGNYHQQVTYAASSTAGDEFFDPYPAISAANNSKSVTMSFSNLQVCPTGVTSWSFDRQIVGSVSVSSCLEISGSVSITDGGLYVDQGSDGNSRAYVKILSGGRLTLVNSTVWSNYPLAFYVANGGNLVTSRGSALTMAARGSPGMLREEGPTSSVTI